MDTKLVTTHINSMFDAAVECSKWNVQGNNKITPVVLIPNKSPCQFWVNIPEGFYCLASAFGKYVGIWASGFNVLKPWESISHMVTNQYIIYDTPVKECPTSDNVMVEVDVSVVFHIKEFEEDVKNFVFKLRPEGLESMLKAFQEEAVRTMARAKKFSSIYDLMDSEELELPAVVAAENAGNVPQAVVGELGAEPVVMPGGAMVAATQPADLNGDGKIDAQEQLENTKRVMNQKLGPYGVKIYSITITNVLLPAAFRHQMEEATTFESKNIRAAARQKYELTVIRDTEKRAQANQMLEEELAEARSMNAQRVANETKITNLFEAGTKAILADIGEKMNADVRVLHNNSELEVAKLEKAKKIELANINAEAEAEALRIRTETDAFVIQTRAQTKADVAALNAEAMKYTAKAEEIAAKQLTQRRDFEEKMSNLRVLKNMAMNEQVAIAGTNKDNVLAQLLASKNSSVALGLNQ